MRKPNIHGGGSKTNLNGLSFEGRTDFIESLKNNKDFKVVIKNSFLSEIIYINQLTHQQN